MVALERQASGGARGARDRSFLWATSYVASPWALTARLERRERNMSETQGPPITLRDMTVIVAREELAQRVREIPPGSNRGPRVDVYLREGGGLDPEGNH